MSKLSVFIEYTLNSTYIYIYKSIDGIKRQKKKHK